MGPKMGNSRNGNALISGVAMRAESQLPHFVTDDWNCRSLFTPLYTHERQCGLNKSVCAINYAHIMGVSHDSGRNACSFLFSNPDRRHRRCMNSSLAFVIPLLARHSALFCWIIYIYWAARPTLTRDVLASGDVIPGSDAFCTLHTK